jgi:hypothetical protein
MRKHLIWLVVFGLGLRIFAAEKTLYENNFENAEVGKVPSEFLVLDGSFTVKEEDGNKFLELPGAPLDSFALQFGPAENSALVTSARIRGTAKGRRYPTFGLGLYGVSGYRLQVSPAKKALELYKDQELKAAAAFDWNSGQWTHLRLEASKLGDAQWKIQGKAWVDGKTEQADWTVTFEENQDPPSGRASVSGSPFSGTPLQFDDLKVYRVEATK